MSTIQIVMLLSALLTGWLIMSFIDAKYGLRFIDWMNGHTANPFKPSEHNASAKQAQIIEAKDEKIATLEARIQVLEKIVTEPAYELNQKINQLK